jgi:hypothetical protein
LVAIEAQEAEATVKAPARDEAVITARQMAPPDSEVMAVSLDGVMINVRGEGWKEVRVATISAVEETVAQERDEEKEVRLTRHSYRAGLWEAKEFAPVGGRLWARIGTCAADCGGGGWGALDLVDHYDVLCALHRDHRLVACGGEALDSR